MKTFFLQLPDVFIPSQYPSKNKRYGLRNNASKELLQLLISKSDYRCMYCGRTVHYGNSHGIVGSFEKEHSIEKKQNNLEYKFLTNCKFNIGISCSDCNNLKKNNLLYLQKKLLSDLTLESCLKKKCTQPCIHYQRLYNQYCEKNFMILKPAGFSSNEKPLRIEYDLINREYQPSSLYKYTNDESDFIKKFIEKLELTTRNNDLLVNLLIFLTSELEKNKDLKSVKKKNGDIVNIYNNVIDDLFIDFICSFEKDKQISIVKTLYKLYIID